ncbi:phosphate ABC transporter permease subunit PstC [Fictibacillus gelatini]|uniref:phosphate ABC transporter permease subunit PstC n=1 Tax=Fictibacillus gelatini TaxID=225985 RepID=UPI00040DBE6D|nr:phosphate ABC transporter permease subunit PstC [Fictibacillus gelatini]
MSNDIRNYSIKELIERKKKRRAKVSFVESLAPKLLALCAIISVLTTLGILVTLLKETATFFSKVSVVEFLTSHKWFPFASGPYAEFGIWPLVLSTLKVTMISMFIAIPVGLSCAIYLSEYASVQTRKVIKPILEVLAGVPTIVFGFFALTFVTPLLKMFIPSLSLFNALSPGIVVGVMIIPMIASLSEDAMKAVPESIREGAFAIGSTRFEAAIKVVLPAASSGIIASFVLGISRALGETMIVTIAGGARPIASLNVTESIQTMTAYIVQVSQGDAGYGTTVYYSIYAVGMALFIFTLLMNLFAQYISRRLRRNQHDS